MQHNALRIDSVDGQGKGNAPDDELEEADFLLQILGGLFRFENYQAEERRLTRSWTCNVVVSLCECGSILMSAMLSSS